MATPNFRHPVTLARDAIALDDLSDGRLDLGLGPGSEGPDASALGQDPWSPAERMARFEEFLAVLRPIVNGDGTTRTTVHTEHYAAVEAPSTPGTVQDPLPLTIAAGGRKGLGWPRLYGQQWVTIGPTGSGPRQPEDILEAAARTQARPARGLRVAARADPMPSKVLLWTPTETVLDSADQFDELAAPYAELGFDEFVLHHPDQTGPYRGDIAAFEEIAARHAT